MSVIAEVRNTFTMPPEAYTFEWPGNDWFFNGLTHDVLNGNNEYERVGKPPRTGRLRRVAASMGNVIGNSLRIARNAAQEKIQAAGRGLSRAGNEIVLGAAGVVVGSYGKHAAGEGSAVDMPSDFTSGQRRHATERFGDIRQFGNSVMTVDVLRNSFDLQESWEKVREMNSAAPVVVPKPAPAPVLEPRLAI